MDLNVTEGNTGKVEVLEVSVDATVADLKKAACAAFGLLASKVELCIQGEAAEKETEPLRALDVHAGSTVTVRAPVANYPDYPGYSYAIRTWEGGGDNYRTLHFDNLSLETAQLYAIHLRSFKAFEAGNYGNEAVANTREALERDLGESYDEDVLPMLVGTWEAEEFEYDESECELWRNIDDVRLTFTPAASKATTLDWNSFVVRVPGLLRDGAPQTKRRREERCAPEASGKDYRLTVRTDECDADNRQTDTYDNLTLTQARLYSSTLAYCSEFGNRPRSLHDEEETTVIEKICAALGIDDDDDAGDDLMQTLFGTWCDCSRWRRVESVTLTRIPNRDLIKDIKYKEFEKQAFELDQAQRAAATDGGEHN